MAKTPSKATFSLNHRPRVMVGFDDYSEVEGRIQRIIVTETHRICKHTSTFIEEHEAPLLADTEVKSEFRGLSKTPGKPGDMCPRCIALEEEEQDEAFKKACEATNTKVENDIAMQLGTGAKQGKKHEKIQKEKQKAFDDITAVLDGEDDFNDSDILAMSDPNLDDFEISETDRDIEQAQAEMLAPVHGGRKLAEQIHPYFGSKKTVLKETEYFLSNLLENAIIGLGNVKDVGENKPYDPFLPKMPPVSEKVVSGLKDARRSLVNTIRGTPTGTGETLNRDWDEIFEDEAESDDGEYGTFQMV